MEMFEDDIITREELKQNTQQLNITINEIEFKINQIENHERSNLTAKQLSDKISRTLEQYTSIANMTNAEIKELIDEISVSDDGKVEIRFRDFDGK